MGLSIWHIVVVLIVVLVLFGAGKLPKVMGDFGRGIRNFKAGLSGDASETDHKDDDAAHTSRLPPVDKCASKDADFDDHGKKG